MKAVRAGRSSVDVAMLHLVRLVVDDDWSPASAGDRLREATPDDAVLRRVHARVIRTLVERRGHLDDRAVATIEAALAIG